MYFHRFIASPELEGTIESNLRAGDFSEVLQCRQEIVHILMVRKCPEKPVFYNTADVENGVVTLYLGPCI